jgi:hypothetical protein
VPTFELTRSCQVDWDKLDPEARARFRAALQRFIHDARRGHFRSGFRVKGVRSAPGVFEMTWAPAGRATFEISATQGRGLHIVWRRIGGHEILDRP